MPEIYTIVFDGASLKFENRTVGVPDCVLDKKLDISKLDKSLQIVSRMGDPDLLDCLVFKRIGQPGGIFALHEKDNLLFVAVAETNLAYGTGLGYFGEMTANARYGADVFENMEEPDD